MNRLLKSEMNSFNLTEFFLTVPFLLPVNEIIKQLPKEITHYHRISIHKGHVLVFEGIFGTNCEIQFIDIF